MTWLGVCRKSCVCLSVCVQECVFSLSGKWINSWLLSGEARVGTSPTKCECVIPTLHWEGIFSQTILSNADNLDIGYIQHIGPSIADLRSAGFNFQRILRQPTRLRLVGRRFRRSSTATGSLWNLKRGAASWESAAVISIEASHCHAKHSLLYFQWFWPSQGCAGVKRRR